MIAICRLQEPRPLRERKDGWSRDFLASTQKRPPRGRYNHKDVVDTLRSMSHGKCFYCESKAGRLTVDHYIEVAERRELTFEWSNLYLACDTCQSKEPNASIPVENCVDPCDSATEPVQHLAFNGADMTFRTPRGEETIRKYRLNHLLQLAERRRHLILFYDLLDQIRQRQIAQKRDTVQPAELAEMQRFAQTDQPVSLMFRELLLRLGLAETQPAT